MKKCVLFYVFVFGIAFSLFAQDSEPDISQMRRATHCFQKGLEYIDSLEHDLAIAEFSKAIAFRPDYTDAYYNRAKVYIDKEKPQKAMQDLDKVILFDPTNTLAYLGRANLYSKQEMFEEAISDYEYIITLEPENIEARYNIVLVAFLSRSQDKEVFEHIDFVIENDEEEKYLNIYKYKGRYEYFFKDSEKSLISLNRYNEISPKDPQGFEFRSETYQMMGEYSKAFEDSEKAKKLEEK